MLPEVETLKKELEYMRSTVKEALDDYDQEMPILSRGSLEGLIEGKDTRYTTEYIEALEEVAKAARPLVEDHEYYNDCTCNWCVVRRAINALDALAKEEKQA